MRTAPDALTDATADIGAMLALMATRRAGEVSPSFARVTRTRTLTNGSRLVPNRQGMRAVLAGKWPEMPWNPLLLCGNGLQNVRCARQVS